MQQETFHRATSRTMVGRTPIDAARSIWYSDWRQHLPIKNNSRKRIRPYLRLNDFLFFLPADALEQRKVCAGDGGH
uniref:Uncharacterized protein n=1 Tax=Setaria italica TaxID=4555 RepID=K3Y0K2_SETIT